MNQTDIPMVEEAYQAFKLVLENRSKSHRIRLYEHLRILKKVIRNLYYVCLLFNINKWHFLINILIRLLENILL